MADKMLSLRSRDYIGICILGFGLMLANGMVFPIITPYANGFTTSWLLIGLSAGVYWMTRMFFEVPTGVLSDKTSRYKIIIFSGILISGISFALTAFITDIYQLLVTRALVGMGNVAFFVATLAYVADHSSSEIRGRALGILQAVEFSTLTLGSSLGGYLEAIFGSRPVFMIGALVQLGFFAFGITSKILRENGSVALTGEEKHNQSFKSSKDLVRVLLTKEVAIASFTIFIVQIMDSGLLSAIVPLYALGPLKMGSLEKGLVMATRGVGVGVGAVLGGLLFDKLYPRMHLINYVLAFALGGIAIFLFTSTNILVLLSLLTGLMGVSFGFVYSTTPALVARSTAQYSVGTAMGAWRIFYDLGGFISPIMLTGIAEFMGMVAPFYLTYSILFLCTVLFIVLVYAMRPVTPNGKIEP